MRKIIRFKTADGIYSREPIDIPVSSFVQLRTIHPKTPVDSNENAPVDESPSMLTRRYEYKGEIEQLEDGRLVYVYEEQV